MLYKEVLQVDKKNTNGPTEKWVKWLTNMKRYSNFLKLWEFKLKKQWNITLPVSVTLAKVKRTSTTYCWWECRQKCTLIHYCRKYKDLQPYLVMAKWQHLLKLKIHIALNLAFHSCSNFIEIKTAVQKTHIYSSAICMRRKTGEKGNSHLRKRDWVNYRTLCSH